MTPNLPAVLYHYTCAHGLRGITADRAIKTNLHPLLGLPLIWLTDLGTCDRSGLGLSSDTLRCDRSAHRVTVRSSPHVQWWPDWADKADIPLLIRDILETQALPMHWWVSPVDLPLLATHPTPNVALKYASPLIRPVTR